MSVLHTWSAPLDRHAPQQVRVDPMALPGQAQPRLGVDRLQAHHPHQPLHPLAVHRLALVRSARPSSAGCRRTGGRCTARRSAASAAGSPPPPPPARSRGSSGSAPATRTADARSSAGWPGSTSGRLGSAEAAAFFFSHSSSILSRPICSNSSAWRASASAAAALGRAAEDALGPGQELLLPAVDQRRVDAVVPGQLVDRLVPLERGQGDLGLERRRVVLPLACHRSPFPGPPEYTRRGRDWHKL